MASDRASLYVGASASFDYQVQSEDVSLQFWPSRLLASDVDVSFLLTAWREQSPPPPPTLEFSGLICKVTEGGALALMREDDEVVDGWPGVSDMSWDWEELDEAYQEVLAGSCPCCAWAPATKHARLEDLPHDLTCGKCGRIPCAACVRTCCICASDDPDPPSRCAFCSEHSGGGCEDHRLYYCAAHAGAKQSACGGCAVGGV